MGSKNPLVLKVDIEGAEYNLLENNKELINSEVNFIAIEFHDVDELVIDEAAVKNFLPNFDLSFTSKENDLLVVFGKKKN